MKTAMARLAEHKKFKVWARLETARLLGREKDLEAKVDYMLATETVAQTKNDSGRFIDNPELTPTFIDIIMEKARKGI